MAKRVGSNQRLKRKENKSKKKRNIQKLQHRMFRLIKGIIVLLLVIGLGVFIVLKSNSFINNTTLFTVRNIVVKGNDKVDKSRVLSLAAIEMDISILNLNTSRIKKSICTLPEVKNVKIKRRIPNTVIITIAERKPIAIVNNGLQYFVDKTGFMWPLKPNTYWDLPVVSGLKDTVINERMHTLKKNEVSKIHSFVNEVKKIDKSIAMDLSQIDFSEDGAVFVKFESKPTLVRLSSVNIKGNIINLKRIFTTVENKNWGMPRHINLCFNNIAFVK